MKPSFLRIMSLLTFGLFGNNNMPDKNQLQPVFQGGGYSNRNCQMSPLAQRKRKTKNRNQRQARSRMYKQRK